MLGEGLSLFVYITSYVIIYVMITREHRVLAALKKSHPKKKRVTFFLTEKSKAALALWCAKHEVSESGAIEEMIKATVPERFFKREG